MARNFVVLALLLVAVIGLASAQSPANAPTSTPSSISPVGLFPDAVASSPDTIGAISDDGSTPSDDAVEAPVGAPVDVATFGPIKAAPAAGPASDATIVKFSAAGLVLAVAGYFF